jgi:hypothetical protein
VSLPRLQTDVEAEAATAVGRTYRFRPVQMNTAGPVNQRLQNLILKPPTPGWPLDNEPGPKAALGYLSETSDNRLSCNPRHDYWTQLLSESNLDDILGEVRAATFPRRGCERPVHECPGEILRVGLLHGAASARPGAPVVGAGPELHAAPRVAVRRRRRQELGGRDGNPATIYKTSRQPDGDVSLYWSQFTSLILKVLGPVTGGVSVEIVDGQRRRIGHLAREPDARRAALRTDNGPGGDSCVFLG